MKQEYVQSPQELIAGLNTSPDGLSSAEAAARLEKYGPNKLKDAEKPTLLQRFIEQLKDPMLIILMIAAAVSAVTNFISGESFAEVFIILIVVLLNAILGVFQFVGAVLFEPGSGLRAAQTVGAGVQPGDQLFWGLHVLLFHFSVYSF